MFYLPPNSISNFFTKIFFCLIFPVINIYAERLLTKIYTIADGLSRDLVYCVKQDSRGFIWFGTAEGLSRFDGYEFKNYPKEYGLPNRSVYNEQNGSQKQNT